MTPFQGLMVVCAVAALAVIIYPVIRNYRVKRKLVCPRTGKEVDVELKCTGGTRNQDVPLEVTSCSAFENPREVDCDQACLEGQTPWERPERTRQKTEA